MRSHAGVRWHGTWWLWIGLVVFGLQLGCGHEAEDGSPEPVADDGEANAAGNGAADQPGPADGADAADPVDAVEPAASDEPGEDTPADPTEGGIAYALDECGLDSGFAGDEQCILPPPADRGFQLHIGPDDYDNPAADYVLEPGQEITNDFVVTASNTEDVFFYFRQYRIRPSTHHMIVSAGSGGPGGRRIATANLSQDNPVGGIIAPENEGVGIPLSAGETLSVSLHSINVTDRPVLRELWVNFWYQDLDQVDEPTTQLFEVGSVSFAIQPGEDTILGPYSCDIPAAGRMLWFYGHRHANNVRFSAWRVRGGQRDLFYEGYEWEEPLLLEYSSLVDNPVADRERHIEGGWSGILDLEPGDRLEWECHVINGRDGVLRFTNETYDGEMCIMDGEIVGTNCAGGGFPFPGFGF